MATVRHLEFAKISIFGLNVLCMCFVITIPNFTLIDQYKRQKLKVYNYM